MAEDQLATVLGDIVDPLFGRSLSHLGLVDEVATRRVGPARVKLKSVVPNHPLREVVEARVAEAAGGRGADIEYELMSDEERSRLMNRLRAEAGPAVGQPGSSTRVLAVSSGKGGVGKSSVSVNLALALTKAGHSVGIVDGDIWGFSIPRMLGIDYPPVVVDESIVPPIAHGVKAMSMDYFVGDDKAVIWRGPMLHKAIEQFLQDVFWDSPDFLIVDMPPGTGDIAISMAQFLPRAQVLVVTTPQPTAQRVARRAALMAEQVDQEVIGIVENMSWFTGDDGTRYELFGSGGGSELAATLGVPLLSQIPLLPAMGRGADAGAPVAVAAPGSEPDVAFAALAEAVVARRPRVRTHPDLVIK